MELVVSTRRGIALSVGVTPQPFLRRATAETELVEVWVGYDGDDPAKAQLLGTVVPGSTLVREWNPDRDRDLRLYQRRLTGEGVPDVGQLHDAESVRLPIKRTTEAPALNLRTDAEHTTAEVGIKVSRHTRLLRVEVSEHADMSSAEVTDTTVGDKLPDVIPLSRTAPSAGTLTLYVRASVSAGGEFSPASDILAVTFADIGGSGGSMGTGGFGPLTHVEIEHEET